MYCSYLYVSAQLAGTEAVIGAPSAGVSCHLPGSGRVALPVQPQGSSPCCHRGTRRAAPRGPPKLPSIGHRSCCAPLTTKPGIQVPGDGHRGQRQAFAKARLRPPSRGTPDAPGLPSSVSRALDSRRLPQSDIKGTARRADALLERDGVDGSTPVWVTDRDPQGEEVGRIITASRAAQRLSSADFMDMPLSRSESAQAAGDPHRIALVESCISG
jgi:hypothetical protein